MFVLIPLHCQPTQGSAFCYSIEMKFWKYMSKLRKVYILKFVKLVCHEEYPKRHIYTMKN